MKYMLSGKILPGFDRRAGEAFLASGAPLPGGLTTVGAALTQVHGT